ncbi:MAG TPA: RidA family protein [Bryobacteraceae bacterium]|jgi:2-iminobutanoate/2-iminopropanoate deaminase|nr:RidA family protein [Bryobacteraceae bacterium]
MIERLSPPGAPVPKGPYSPAVKAGGFVFVSGQVPGEKGDIQHETRQVLNNLKTILEGAGSSLAQVVRVGVYLADGADFAKMNEVYAEFFGENKPARTTIVCKFVADIRIEADCVAYCG